VTDEGEQPPQPASAVVDEQTARWYVEYTGGQFGMHPVGDGRYYLYLAVENPSTDSPPGGPS
jgi:hypothetical protein